MEILLLKEGLYSAYFFGNPAFMFEITLDIERDGDAFSCVNNFTLWTLEYPREEHACGRM